MPIKSLKLSNVGPFRPHARKGELYDIELQFDGQVNLLIGPNNSGKSTILLTLAMIAGGNAVREGLPAHFKNALYEWTRGEPCYGMEWSNRYGEPRQSSNLLSAFETGSGLYGTVGDTYEMSDATVGSETEILMLELGYMGYYNPEALTATGIDNISTDSIVPEIVSGFPLDILDEIFEETDLADEARADDWKLGLEAFGTPDGLVAFPELSHGTRSVLDWVRQFESGMKRYYQAHSDWKKMPGVFIIDEIDAHLHPSWQRRIIPTLQRHFPNVQIFASTHSPMMVAGLKKGQVHLLKRDATGQVVWSRNEQDIIGWTADEIYRMFMGIDDPTDKLTVQRANRLRELRDKEARTEAEEDEMNTLRRQVNQDLLSKGPVGPQNERYLELMHRFLRSLETELSQDGA